MDYNDSIIKEDLNNILLNTESLWYSLKDAKFFITGGTGFIGKWLLESLCYANDLLDLNIHATVLTRDPKRFNEYMPHIVNNKAIKLISGDILDMPRLVGEFTHLIHAATESNATLSKENPLLMFDTIVNGTRNVLNFAVDHGITKALYISSGAIYGKQPYELASVYETWPQAPVYTDNNVMYSEGKRAAEVLCRIFSDTNDISISIARGFAFCGPYLPLDGHLAVGNFIRDALKGGPIVVNSDGTSIRTYQYTSDMTSWLWHMLCNGNNMAYNLGSSNAISIRNLAYTVADVLDVEDVIIKESPIHGVLPHRYVPSIVRAKNNLGLTNSVTLEEAILRTAIWNGFKV